MKKNLLILFTLLITTLGYSQQFIENFITYQVITANPTTVRTANYNAASGGTVVDIPATVTNNGTTYDVVEIGAGSFNNKQLTSVTLPNSIITISGIAFSSNQLTSVIIPDGVITIESSAFGINQLTSIVIPNSVTSIGIFAFQANMITNFTLSNNVTVLNNGIFNNNQIQTVTIPSSITNIGSSVFDNNPISNIISEATSPPSIQPNTFGDRSGIDVLVPAGSGAAYNAAQQWAGFNSITEDIFFEDNFITYEITSTTTNTVEARDYDMAGGPSVDIPAAVSYNGVMYSVTSIGAQSFVVNQLTSVTIPNSVTNIGIAAFSGNQLTSIAIPNSLTSIAQTAFRSNELTSLTIPNNVTNIGIGAFANNQLTSITIPAGVINIGNAAFNNNPLNSVTSLATIPPTINTSGDNFDSFANDRSGIDLTIPAGTLGEYVTDTGALWTGFNTVTEDFQVGDTFISDFITYELTTNTTVAAIDYDTAGGAMVDIPATKANGMVNYDVNQVGDFAFASNSLTNVTLAGSITSIGLQAFVDNALSSISVPDGVTSIGQGAFALNNLSNIVIPDSVTTLGDSAFENNVLTSATLPNALTAISNNVFNGNNLTSFTIPDTVTSIGISAFFGNQLTSITIPENVTTIGSGAFSDNLLTTVTSEAIVPPTITTTGDASDTFGTDRPNIDLFIPSGTFDAYVADPGALWTDFKSVTDPLLSISNVTLVDEVTILNSSEMLQIITNGTSILQGYRVFNISAGLVKTGTHSTIEISDLSNGVYILELTFDTGSLVKKFAK